MITIEKKTVPSYPLVWSDLENGRAYESESGDIFIGFEYRDIRAVSLDGTTAIGEGNSRRFREVNLKVTVTTKN